MIRGHYLDPARAMVDWAAPTITARGGTLHAVETGWDVEMPDGSWRAANGPRELCDVAKELLSLGKNADMVGKRVKIRQGYVGAGYAFTVTATGTSGHGEPIVYGQNYGPVRLSEIEVRS